MTLISKSQISPYIEIEALTDSDVKAANNALNKIASKPIGNSLLKEISKKGKEEKMLMIQVDKSGLTSAKHALSGIKYFQLVTAKDPRLSDTKMLLRSLSKRKSDGSKGEGASAIVRFNPNIAVGTDENGNPYPELNPESAFIGLSHELIHAYYMMNGDWLGGGDMMDYLNENSAVRHEEDRAVGLGKYANEMFTENKIRAEHGFPSRNSYVSIKSIQDLSDLGIDFKLK